MTSPHLLPSPLKGANPPTSIDQETDPEWAGQGGVARALSLVIASQLLLGLLLDALGIFGAGVELSWPMLLGVFLVLAGGILVVRY